jgi:hypothetical protein
MNNADEYCSLIERKLEALRGDAKYHYAAGLREYRVLCEMFREEKRNMLKHDGVSALNALVDDVEFEGPKQ